MSSVAGVSPGLKKHLIIASHSPPHRPVIALCNAKHIARNEGTLIAQIKQVTYNGSLGLFYCKQ